VISAEHNRNRAGRGDLMNFSIDLTVAVLNTTWYDRGIASINGGKDAEWVNANLQ
jgi:hypothetical protein